MLFQINNVVALVPLPIAGDGNFKTIRHNVKRGRKRGVVIEEVRSRQLIRRDLLRSYVVHPNEVLAGDLRLYAVQQVIVREYTRRISKDGIPAWSFASIADNDSPVRSLNDDVIPATGSKADAEECNSGAWIILSLV